MSDKPLKKKCGGCGFVKAASEFGINRSRYDGLQCHCRDCKRTFQSNWYVKNKADHIETVNRQRRERTRTIRTQLHHYLAQHSCVDCGEMEPLLLDFDHVRGDKIMAVSQMVSSGLSWGTILSEIAKCEVRCVKCHRRKTAQQMGWHQ